MTDHDYRPADLRRIERAEYDIERAEAHLAQMKGVRQRVLTRALPFLTLVVVAVFGSGGWGIFDLLPVSVAAVVLGGTAGFGWLGHLGVRQAEERIDRLTEDMAEDIARAETARRRVEGP